MYYIIRFPRKRDSIKWITDNGNKFLYGVLNLRDLKEIISDIRNVYKADDDDDGIPLHGAPENSPYSYTQPKEYCCGNARYDFRIIKNARGSRANIVNPV